MGGKRRSKGLAYQLRELLADLLAGLQALLLAAYNATLPVTSRLFSRKPNAPFLAVQDVRARRVRLDIKSSFSSPFNTEQFEVEWSPLDSNAWKSIGKSNLKQRTVARLQADTWYKFRARAHNWRGSSGWSEVVSTRTRIDPVNGGGTSDGFTWEQTHTDVTIMFQVPPGTQKKDVRLQLKPEWLSVAVAPPGAGEATILLEGELYGRVRGWTNGSCWHLARERGQQVLTLTLEKATPSVAPKFDYWRAVIPGQHEIDTHQIVDEKDGAAGADGNTRLLRPGDYDPRQLRNMGIKLA